MFIEHLETFRFRNLQRLSFDLGPNTVVLEGPNAQGKTNILEALNVCATGKSFRRAKPRELLCHGAHQGFVKARFSRQGVRHDVEVELSPTRRTVKVDGRGLRRASKLLELINVVAFFPDDLRIIKGSPEERRNFLDRAVANHRSEFVDATLSYGKALKARNSLLRQDSVDRDMIGVYDTQLVEHGLILHRCRQETLTALQPLVVEHFGRVMQSDITLGLGLLSGLPDAAGELDADRFAAALHNSYPRDRARGLTNVGPHRADLNFDLDGQPARQFASQGQQRALVLALKLAEVVYLRARLDCAPILLLDDVSSELDSERTRLLFEVVGGLDSQVWVTTTGAAPLPLPADVNHFQVRNGSLQTSPAQP